MSEVPPTDIDRRNQQALAELCRLLRFSQGEFELILAVCNSTRQRQALVDQLRQECPIPFDEITLDPTTATLFTTIRDSLSSPLPAALMVYGLAGVQDPEQMLTATNQIREEFRQFPFPLVLWLTDRGLKQLIRTAPDFYTWANPVTFETPPAFFLAFLDELTQDIWQQVLQSRENRFLSNQELGLTPRSDRYQELETSLAALAANKISLTVEQSADLAFVQGRIADNNTPTAREHYESSLTQWQDLLDQNNHNPTATPHHLVESPLSPSPPHSLTHPLTHSPSPSTQNPYTEKIGHVQFYLGLWWRNQAERYRQTFKAACNRACEYFEAAVQTLESAQRSDLAAQYINYWAESLHRLKRWPELETVATKALTLHQQQQQPFRVARAEGFLAEVALSKQDWPAAQRHAEAALALIQPIADSLANVSDGLLNPLTSGNDGPLNPTMLGDLDTSDQLAPGNAEAPNPAILGALEEDIAFCVWINSFHRSWYLFSLGRAQLGQGQIDAAVTTLEQARAVTEPEYDPALYSRVLEQLRQGYFQQGKYLPAFETRRQKDAIESRFNFRAFVGAGRLQPKQKIANPALPVEVNKDAIMASGRKHDVQRLVKRLAQDENVLTIVYGPSGVGKSSLIEAGLVPALEQTRLETRQVVPIYLRRYRDWTGDLLTTLADLAAGHAPSDSGILRYPKPQEVSPIIRFRSSPAPSNEQLPPSQEEIVSEKLRRRTQRNQVMVLIFDQFEEFFFEFEQAADRRPFYDFLRNCLAMPFIKVVLSLREDYIHYLLECDRLTNLEIIDNNILDKKWLYYLGNFSPEDTQAIFQELTDPTPYNPEPVLVAQVVTDLAAGAGEIRPIELQIVGAQLQREKITSLSTYQDWGDPNQPTKELLVQKYLTDIVKECGLEAHQRIADIVLYLLTDEKGTRPLKTKSDLADNLPKFMDQTDLSSEALSLVLKILQESGLIMEVPEAPEDRYQLVHDYVASFIREKEARKIEKLRDDLTYEKQKRGKIEKRLSRFSKILTIVLAGGLLSSLVFLLRIEILSARAEKNSILALIRSSESLHSANQSEFIDPLIESMKAARAYQASTWKDPNVEFLVAISLQKSLSKVREVNRLKGHSKSVIDVNYSPDGKLIASAGDDDLIKIWKKDGTLVQTLKGHSDSVRSVVFSPDGELIASASYDKTVKIWDLDGALIGTLNGHEGKVNSVAFSPDGEKIASASGDRSIKIWSVSGEELITLRGHNSWVTSVAFSNSGEMLASSSSDGTIKIWAQSGELIQTIESHQSPVNKVVFSPNNEVLASAANDGVIKLWKFDGTLIQKIEAHEGKIWDISFSFDSEILASASGGRDKAINFWNLKGELLDSYELGESSDIFFSVAFSPEARILASGSSNEQVSIWRFDNPNETAVSYDQKLVSKISFNPINKSLALVIGDRYIKWIDYDGDLIDSFDNFQEKISSIIFSPDGKMLVSASEDGIIKFWNDTTGQPIKAWDSQQEKISSITFSPDGKMLISASEDGIVKFWNNDTERAIKVFDSQQEKISSINFSPDGKMFVSASEDGTIKSWNNAGQLIAVFDNHQQAISNVVFSPDGRKVVSAGKDGEVNIWALDGKLIEKIPSLLGDISDLDYSSKGHILAISGTDGKVHFWHPLEGEIATLELHDSETEIFSSFSADGNSFVSSGFDGKLNLWNLNINELVFMSCDWIQDYWDEEDNLTSIDESLCPKLNSDVEK